MPQAVERLVAAHGLFQELRWRDRALLWRHRAHLVRLRAVSLLARSVDWADRAQVLSFYRLLQTCPRLDPFGALFLLDARFPDPKLRAFAVRSLDAMSDFTLSQVMLQLVQVKRGATRFSANRFFLFVRLKDFFFLKF